MVSRSTRVPTAPTPPARLEPTAKERYMLQLTASRALHDKLEKTRRATAKRPRERQKAQHAKRGYVTRAARREVFARDGAQCTYVSVDGERCTARGWLELDHIVPKACGGSDEVANLRVRCGAHNHLHAEETFGKEHVAERIHFRRRKSEVDLARRGLVRLGFKASEAKHALDLVCERHGADAAPLPKETMLREALSVLVP